MIESLPRREREVFEALCSLGEGTAIAVRGALADPPSDSAVRTLLGRLEAKGLIGHGTRNQAYVYRPVVQADSVAETALQRLVHPVRHALVRRDPARVVIDQLNLVVL